MKTIQSIRKDLRSIRYYYGRKDMFEEAFESVGRNTVSELAQLYNRAVCDAEPKLYELYVCLYVKSNTQEAGASILQCSVDYIAKYHKRLLKFFYDYFNEKDVA